MGCTIQMRRGDSWATRRGESDYATVLCGAQVESEAVRNLSVETSVVEIGRGVPETRAVPATKASETLSPHLCLGQRRL